MGEIGKHIDQIQLLQKLPKTEILDKSQKIVRNNMSSILQRTKHILYCINSTVLYFTLQYFLVSRITLLQKIIDISELHIQNVPNHNTFHLQFHAQPSSIK